MQSLIELGGLLGLNAENFYTSFVGPYGPIRGEQNSMRKITIRTRSSRLLFVTYGKKLPRMSWAPAVSDVLALSILSSEVGDSFVNQGLIEVYRVLWPGDPLISTQDLVTRIGTAIAAQTLHVYLATVDQTETQYKSLVEIGFVKDDTPVPFLDDRGRPVLDVTGSPMKWRKAPRPNFFVDRGLADKDDILSSTLLADRLMRFWQGHSWDLQRTNGKVISVFIDSATVAIGLYCAAFGVSQDLALDLQEVYAWSRSNFRGVPRDKQYTHLPVRNVFNTRLGYNLYLQGLIGKTSASVK